MFIVLKIFYFKFGDCTKNVYDVTITIPDIIQRPVFYLKLDTSKPISCLRVHVQPKFGPIDRDYPWLNVLIWAE